MAVERWLGEQEEKSERKQADTRKRPWTVMDWNKVRDSPGQSHDPSSSNWGGGCEACKKPTRILSCGIHRSNALGVAAAQRARVWK